jgi:hypothetical protein
MYWSYIMPSFSLLTLAQDVELLNDSNWHNWKDKILMVLGADGVSAGIVSGTTVHPADQAGASDWDKKDCAALSILWVCMSKSTCSVTKGETSGKAIYVKLHAKHEKSTWSCCVAICDAFYRVIHDMSKPINHYV